MSNQGTKHDNGKPRLNLLPYQALAGVSQVLGYGAKLYGEWNWHQGLNYTRCAAAALRHVYQFLDGQDLDDDTKLQHIDHAICELMFLSTFIHEGRKDLDDRRKQSVQSDFKLDGKFWDSYDLVLRHSDAAYWDAGSLEWRAGVALYSDQK